MISKINIVGASEQYRQIVNVCREVFAASGQTFVEPKGVSDHIRKARDLYGVAGNEAAAITEVENARHWLIGVARKRLSNGPDFYGGKIRELSFMSLDQDIMENMEALMRDFCAALVLEDGDSFELRVPAYRDLVAAINGARIEQGARNEERERLAHEQVQRQEEERRQRRIEMEREKAEAEAAARAEREQQFDALFAQV